MGDCDSGFIIGRGPLGGLNLDASFVSGSL